MSRKRRCCPPATLQHLICRFLDREHRFTDDRDRASYLSLLDKYATRSDWRWVTYALMSSHVHLSSLTGHHTLSRIFQPLHVRFAQSWHQRHGGLGPVFADRPANHRVRPQRFGELIAYNHMDPVRNKVVQRPADSRWTSHRCYLRLDPAPAWLDVQLGLSLAGFEDTEADRRRFDEYVRSTQRRHWQHDITDLYRADDNVALDDLVEVTSPHFGWDELVTTACMIAGVPASALHSPSRCRRVTRVRHVIARIAHDDLTMTPASISARLNRSRSTISHVINSRSPDQAALISRVKQALRDLDQSRD